MFGDRFIPIRPMDDFLASSCKLKLMDNFNSNKLYHHLLYKSLISSSFRSIVNYSKTTFSSSFMSNFPRKQVYIWNVRSREKPFSWQTSPFKCYLFDKSAVYTRYDHPLDWSDRGFLSFVDEDIVLRDPLRDMRPRVLKFSQALAPYIKWNTSGDLFAVLSLPRRNILIWDATNNSFVIDSLHCACGGLDCIITVVEWRRDNILFSGCDRGRLCIWKEHSLLWNILLSSESSIAAIIDIKVSNNQNYFSVVIGPYQVVLFHWPPRIMYRIEATQVAWHPWQESLLCCISHYGNLFLFNVATKKFVDVLVFMSNNNNWGKVDALTWNELSGELIASRTESNINRIIVYSNFNKIVETLERPAFRIPQLLWSPCRSILGSFDSDALILCLWNYFGPNSRRKKSKLNPLSIHSNTFGSCIR